MPKQRRDQGRGPAAATTAQQTCILHVTSMSDHGHLTSLDKIKGNAEEKLQQLLTIRDQRLHQSHESPYRMQPVCDQIPTTLPDDLESVGYHRQCYVRFTANLHWLGDDTEPEASTSQRHLSPRKSSSAGPIFPPECIFCGKPEIKDGDRKTERAENFSSYKNKTICMGEN